MNRQIEFLRFLQKSGADIEHIDITEKLQKLGLKTEERCYSFLNSLQSKNYIEWHDLRPRRIYQDEYIVYLNGIPDPKQKLKFTAQLTLIGSEYVDDRTIKAGGNNISKFNVGITLVSLCFGVYQYHRSTQKDEGIKVSKDEKAVLISQLNTKVDSLLSHQSGTY